MTPSRRWLGLLAASLGNFLGALDVTVNVALPAMTSHFATDMTLMQWIITFYIGTATALQLIVGKLADDWGLRRIYLLGISVYALAVLAVGLAPTLEWVFAWRVMQALGYGMILATSAALVTQLFGDAERGRALGLMASIGTLGMIVATAVGGVLIDRFGWSAIFVGRLPFAALALLLTFAVLPATPRRAGAHLDAVTAISLFAGLVALVLALSLGGRLGWLHAGVFALAAGGAGLLAVFARRDRRSSSPILDLGLVRHALIAPALLSGFLLFGASFINLFVLPYFVVDVLGNSAAVLGVLMTLTPMAAALSAPLAGSLSDRIAPQWVSLAALLWAAAVLFAFSRLGVLASPLQVGACLAAFGVAMGAFQASNANIVMGNVPRDRLGAGAALLALAGSLGMVTSVAALGSAFALLQRHAPATLPPAERFALAFSQLYLLATALVLLAVVLAASGLLRLRRQARLAQPPA